MNAADAHLAQGPRDGGADRAISAGRSPARSPASRPADVYGALLRSITGQQLSVKAAAGDLRAPDRALRRPRRRRPRSCSPTTRRRCARPPASRARRSPRCARWPSTCSRASCSSTRLDELPDEEVIARARRGQGHRRVDGAHVPDVHPAPAGRPARPATRASRTPSKRAYGLDAVPKPDAMIEIAEPWRPYRTRACQYSGARSTTRLSEARFFEVEVALDQPLDRPG